MQTNHYPLWKSVLWVLGILAYGLGATVLGAFAAWLLGVAAYLKIALPFEVLTGPKLGFYLYACVVAGLWVGLLAVAPWQLVAHRHKTAGRALAVMAGISMVLSLYLGTWLSLGKWWLGWVGVPNPMPLRDTCHDWVGSGCADFHATETAEAPHPPAWLPWIPPSTATYLGPMIVNLQDVVAHPESYQWKWVEIRDVEVLHVYSNAGQFEFAVGTPSETIYVVAPDVYYLGGLEHQMVTVAGIVDGDCKVGIPYPAKVILCRAAFRDSH